jgi:hypothetical protein
MFAALFSENDMVLTTNKPVGVFSKPLKQALLSTYPYYLLPDFGYNNASNHKRNIAYKYIHVCTKSGCTYFFFGKLIRMSLVLEYVIDMSLQYLQNINTQYLHEKTFCSIAHDS